MLYIHARYTEQGISQPQYWSYYMLKHHSSEFEKLEWLISHTFIYLICVLVLWGRNTMLYSKYIHMYHINKHEHLGQIHVTKGQRNIFSFNSQMKVKLTLNAASSDVEICRWCIDVGLIKCILWHIYVFQLY